ncbi:MAG: DUF2330 domain-containing protein [Polyangiaceae bacterium]|nr:DUF2330 domain-containing protein [Polyangiaceae bacterium]
MRHFSARTLALAVPLALAAATTSHDADAFCGFYIAGADAKLFNNATMVVMMREGTKTVLSMQNNYQGPPENFAMVVPVPIVLQEDNVKTLPDAIFDRVDKLAAPRLVEYWEQDPCYEPPVYKHSEMEGAYPSAAPADDAAMMPRGAGVTVEAKFAVGEYEIVILSAKFATGLEEWLVDNKYKIPSGAAPLLRPYIQGGMKFFVAKVDVKKVKFDSKGMAKLSPLRFHYDSESFNLPIRLGLINSGGTQDLIVHILARGVRYEAANYKNVTIPTNLDVSEEARTQFGAFYAALFDETVAKNPGAVVTEYSWGAESCDPCPSSPLEGADFATLGGDVIPPSKGDQFDPRNSMVLTRLHARYGKESLGEDLVFREAPPIVGGREHLQENGKLETGARIMEGGGVSNFQGRYAIRHAWKGAINCMNPKRGVWGGPPAGEQSHGTQVAQDLAFAPRGQLQLAGFVQHDVPEIGLVAAAPDKVPQAGGLPAAELQRGGCASCFIGASDVSGRAAWMAGIAGLAGIAGFVVRRGKRRSSSER